MTWNPYLDGWAAARGFWVRGWITHGQLGADASEHRALACWPDTEHNRRLIRSHLTRKYAFAVPDETALACLARYSPIVEIGAGTGYWARCLRERGVDVIAYDELGEQWQTWFHPRVLRDQETGRGERALIAQLDPAHSDPIQWTELLRGGPEVLAEHGERTLLLCWPDPWSGFDEAALRAHRGRHLAFVGEPATGGTEGFRRLRQRGWRWIDETAVPQWHDVEDRLVVYERQ